MGEIKKLELNKYNTLLHILNEKYQKQGGIKDVRILMQ